MKARRRWLIAALCACIGTGAVIIGAQAIGRQPAVAGSLLDSKTAARPVAALSPPLGKRGTPNTPEEQAKLAQMERVADNAYLSLYLDRATAEIAVKDKREDYAWFSNPVGRENDKLASPLYKAEMSSQVTVSYYNEKGQLSTYNSYEESVAKKQFKIGAVDGGIKIEYVIGKMAAGMDGIPKAIGKQRMEDKILSKLKDESARNSVLYKYRLNEKTGVYEVRELQDYVKKELQQLLDTAGYTKEDAAADNKANGAAGGEESGAESVSFTVPVIYTLENDQLVVTVPAGEVKYPKSFPISSLDVLPYFGAASTDKEGYMLVPDGSGALIRLNNGKLSAEPYRLPIYGEDGTFVVKEKAQTNEASRLPVFGMKQNDHAFLGIMQDGEALASVKADISGRYVSYNSVGSSYRLVNMDFYTLSSGDRTSSVPMFQKKPYDGNIRLRYAFAGGESADYSGMAALYRGYLAQSYGLKRLDAAAGSPFILELAGAFRKPKSFLGVPYEATEALTSYSEAQQLAEKLKERGVNNIALRYVGWFNGGIRHSTPADVSPVGVLGGRSGLERLVRYAQDNRIKLYADAAFLEAYKKPKLPASFLDRSAAKIYEYDPVMQTQNFTLLSHYIVSPLGLGRLVEGFTADLAKLGIHHISLRDMGSEVNSDYDPNHPVDRQSARRLIEGGIAGLKRQEGSLLVSGGNAYSLPYADIVVNAPMQSSRMNLTDEEVPFYQIALHGYVQLAGEPFNTSAPQSPRRSMLKALETGSNVYYEWFYSEPSVVKDTEFNFLYALYYKNWFDEAVALYQEASRVLDGVAGQTIVSHRRLEDGVYQTAYENGTTVTVNYNKTAVTVSGMRIDAEEYAVQSGGRNVKGGG